MPMSRPRNLSYIELDVKPNEVAGHFPPVWVYLKCPSKYVFTGHQGDEIYFKFLKEELGTCNIFKFFSVYSSLFCCSFYLYMTKGIFQ